MTSKLLLLCLLFFISQHMVAQDFSNKGTDFWIIYTGHVDGTTSRMAIYLTSDINATGSVVVNGATIPFTVTANQITTIQFTQASTPSNSVVYNDQLEGIGSKRGIHIISDKPIVAYAHILNAARSGSTLVLPTNVLGREYFVSSYDPIDLTSKDRSEFAVVAVEDNTTLEITPTGDDAAGVHTANVPFQVSLSKGDVYQYQSNYDLTGTHIISIATGTTGCKPIAVFSGSTRSYVGCASPGSGDNLYQQLFPFASWGKLYYTAPFANRAYDVFRIIVQDTTTTVTVNGTALSKSKLIRGRFYDFNTQGNNVAQVISADKPVCVFQYMITQSCDNVESDPEMIVLNAADQTLNDITVMSARKDLTPPNTNIDNHYLNIIYKTVSFGSLRIDGLPPFGTPKVIPGTGYSYVQEDVTASTNINPAHHITNDSGFICLAYGTGRIESYGYNAGTNVIDRYQYLTVKNLNASVNFPATCRKTPFYFSLTLPYKPSSLNWNFYNNPRLVPNANISISAPVPDSTFVVDGKTLYLFKLSAVFSYDSTGTFPIQVTAQNPTADGCGGLQFISYNVVVFEKPGVDFTFPTSICYGDSVRFADATNGGGRPIISWNWTLGNGNVATVKNPVAWYLSPGNYPVKLQAMNDIGCLSDTTKSVTISSLPVAKFKTIGNACLNKSISFIDSSYSTVGNIVEWKWDFGDSTASIINTTNAGVTHAFAAVKSYTVTLTVRTSAGCIDSVKKTIVIRAQPVAGFITPKVCLNDAFAQFTDSSYISDGTASFFNYAWNFGDANAVSTNPNISTLQNPLHKYTATGSYTATLVVTSLYGCIDTAIKTFQVNGSYPAANFTIADSNQLCTNRIVRLTNLSTVFPGNLTRFDIQWDAPGVSDIDNSPVALKQYLHQYPALLSTKTYLVKVIAYSGQTCADSVIRPVVVHPSPVASFTAVPDVCYTDAPFQLTQAVENTGLAGTALFSGNGTASSGLFTPSSVQFPNVNTTVPLYYTYTTPNGCTDSDTSSVTIHKVTVDAGKDILMLEGTTVPLQPTVAATNPSYSWSPATWLSFSNVLAPSTSATADITYTLTVKDNVGCKNADTVAVKVLKLPIVPNAFSPNGDGVNDVWGIRYLNTYRGANVQVFNRYGSLMYNSIGYDKPWDGTYNGSPAPVGVYYYIINPGSGRPLMKGWVTLLR